MIHAAIVSHVALGATWVLATLVVAAISRIGRPLWLKLILGVALLNMLAGVYLWHTLHAGPWGPPERLLAAGTFGAFIALGMQAAVAFTLPPDTRRIEGAVLWVYRITAFLVLGVAAAMVAAKA